MVININSIMEKIKNKVDNGDLATKIKESKIKLLNDENKDSRKRIFDYKYYIARYFKCLRNSIPMNEEALIKIIEDIIETATILNTKQKEKDMFGVGIYFDETHLKRQSLLIEENRYSGNGIDNIIALFNNGYAIETTKLPYGNWVTHGIEVQAKRYRNPIRFMQKSRDEFLLKNKDNRNIEIKINKIYNGGDYDGK